MILSYIQINRLVTESENLISTKYKAHAYMIFFLFLRWRRLGTTNLVHVILVFNQNTSNNMGLVRCFKVLMPQQK